MIFSSLTDFSSILVLLLPVIFNSCYSQPVAFSSDPQEKVINHLYNLLQQQ